jgi:tRNA(fMet)-specific endonuclease VapC
MNCYSVANVYPFHVNVKSLNNIYIKLLLSYLSCPQDAAEWHAQERARLSLIGKTPPFVDGQIAAIAKVNDLIIVTANISDYQAFSGLMIENWFLPEARRA